MRLRRVGASNPHAPAAADATAAAPYIRLKLAAANSTSRIASRSPT
ncbi:hypothetical protein BZZ08_07001 [Streptomyces sp. MH60]|nr:hypothetical protein BZZ08_07001 [Streptomyces sp. MH60]